MPRLPSANDLQTDTPRFGGYVKKVEVRDEGERALQNVGKGLEHFGEALAKVKINDDKMRVEEATTRLQQKRIELYKGDGKEKKGFIDTRSADVVEDAHFYNNRMEEYDNVAKEIADSLGNDEQKAMFNRRNSVNRNGHENDLLNHMTKEREAFYKQAYEGGISSDIDIATLDYDNPDKVGATILRTQKLTETEADRLGIKGKARTQMIKDNVSNLHAAVIAKAVDDGSNSYAQDWYNQNKKNITAESQHKLEKLLKVSGIKADSQEATDRYMDEEKLTEGEAIAKARKEFKNKPEVRDATVARIKARAGEQAAQLDAAQKAAGEQAWTLYGKTKDINSIPLTLLEQMDGKERVALEQVAIKGEENIKTDWGTYYSLKQMAVDNPLEFRKLNLGGYFQFLSPTDKKALINMQTDPQELETARSKTMIMKEGANAAGINSKQIKQGFGDDIEKYYKRIDDEVMAYQINTGKAPDNNTITEIVNRINLNIVKDPKAFFFTGKRPAYSAEIEGVPTDLVDDLAKLLEGRVDDNGNPVPIDDASIKSMYLYLQRKKTE